MRHDDESDGHLHHIQHTREYGLNLIQRSTATSKDSFRDLFW